MTRGYDPFSAIPSAKAVRQRLAEVELQAKKLRALLVTAERIEAGGIDDTTKIAIPSTADIRAEMAEHYSRVRVLRSLFRIARKVEAASMSEPRNRS